VVSGGLPFDSVQPALRLLVKNLLATDTRKYQFVAEVHTTDGKSAKADNVIDTTMLPTFHMSIWYKAKRSKLC